MHPQCIFYFSFFKRTVYFKFLIAVFLNNSVKNWLWRYIVDIFIEAEFFKNTIHIGTYFDVKIRIGSF